MGKKKQFYTGISLISVAVFILLWEYIAVHRIVDPIFIGRPSLILGEFLSFFSNKIFLTSYFASIKTLLLGYLIALILGTVLGIIFGLNKLIYAALKPYIYAINSIPALAFIPIIIIWFGIGVFPKFFIIVLTAIIPMILNVIEGVNSVDKKLLKMAQSFSAGYFFRVKKIIIYEVIPFVVSGARNALGKAFVALIIAEFYGLGKDGLGYYISYYGETYKTNKFFAVLGVVLLTSLVLTYLLKLIERYIKKWKNGYKLPPQ